jgi:hypothetical protein
LASIPTQSNEILVSTPESVDARIIPGANNGKLLVSWIVERTSAWKDQRDRGYAKRWGEYWRIWRGMWQDEDKNRSSERSQLVTPALSQAIEQTVAELEEAIFSQESWFDIADDLADKEKTDAMIARDNLLEDLEVVNGPDALSEAILNGAIFGSGAVKINVHVGGEKKPVRNPDTKRLEAKSNERVYVTIESIRPDQLIPDPSATDVQSMLGIAHEIRKPLHAVLEKIQSGAYRKAALADLSPTQRNSNLDIDQSDPQSMLQPNDSDAVTILEYHGKVPKYLLDDVASAKNALDALLDGEPAESDDLVEAIVTIANEQTLLRAIPNPFVMKDRSIVVFQFEKVPGRFWGRGVAEKGYNPQKALDAEVRARIDALGFISAPMLGVDSGRIPKGFKMEVRPGKIWTTNGPPDEVLRPVSIGNIDANTFNQASEMERMVQMGTGAFDTATALKAQSQSGASGLASNSMLMGAFVKRSKRAVRSISNNLVTPVIKKVTWRYMQYDQMRYPQDYEFVVKPTLGIVAREVEAAQLTQTMGMLPDKFDNVKGALALGIIEHTSIQNKAQILQLANQALQPPSQEQQQMQQEMVQAQITGAKAQAQGFVYENMLTLAKRDNELAQAQATMAGLSLESEKNKQEWERLANEREDIKTYQIQNAQALVRLKLDARALEQKDRELDIKDKVATAQVKKAAQPSAS